MIGRLRPIAAIVLILGGVLAVVVGGGAYIAAWSAARSWSTSAEAERAEHALASQAPLWVEPTTASPLAAAPTATGVPPPRVAKAPAVPFDDAPPALADADEIELASAEFRFLDPPEPGAHARLAVELRSHADAPSELVSVGVDARWFKGFDVIGAAPNVADDRVDGEGKRYFDFPSLSPGTSARLELHLVATGEDLDAPKVEVRLYGGASIGEATPQTVAPRPRPGPARALSFPRLGIQSSVIPTAWEPVPIVVGQLQASAPVSLGNTVLVGHLGGPQGNVFAPLDRARVGDEVVAISRGLEYRFVVSDIIVLPKEDSSPTFATETPRLTLMTCTGRWNPITDEYSHRFWVIAEPPELAQATIKARAEREAAARAEAERAAAERAAAERAAAEEERARLAEASREEGAVGVVEETQPAPAQTSAPSLFPMPPAAPTSEPRPAAPAPTRAPAIAQAPRPPDGGVTIRSPLPDAKVPRRFVAEGVRTRPLDPGAHAWLFVRAQQPAARWYPYPRELPFGPDGSWKAEIDLDGPPDLRHELRVVTVDDKAHATLIRWVAEHPNQPVENLPDELRDSARVVVIRD
jgi:LPXTG-site transpeptidase (sortase) family protein